MNWNVLLKGELKMTQELQWELILQHNHYPCFVADMDTYDLVYVNSEYISPI